MAVSIAKGLVVFLMVLCIAAFGVAVFVGLYSGYDDKVITTLAVSVITFILALMAVRDDNVWEPMESDD